MDATIHYPFFINDCTDPKVVAQDDLKGDGYLMGFDLWFWIKFWGLIGLLNICFILIIDHAEGDETLRRRRNAMTMVKIYFRTPVGFNPQEFDEIMGKEHNTIFPVEIIPEWNGEVGYLGGRPVVYVEAHVSQASDIVQHLLRLECDPLFVY